MSDYPYRPEEPESPYPSDPIDETSPEEFDPADESAESTAARAKSAAGTPIRDVWKQVEQTVGAALQGRGNVVMVRVNDEALRHLDMLMEAEVTKSRSESAALLINEGIKANRALFDRIGEITEQIDALRAELRASIRRPQPSEE